MSAAANAIDEASIDDGWVLDQPATASAAPPVCVDDGWALDEPLEAPARVLTIVADYEDEYEPDIEIIAADDDGWSISHEEAAFFAEGEALATKRRPPPEDFSDLGSVKPDKGFWTRLLRRSA